MLKKLKLKRFYEANILKKKKKAKWWSQQGVKEKQMNQ